MHRSRRYHADPSRISPTAHYTGQVWQRAGLADPALATWQGRALHAALRGPMLVQRALGGPTLDGVLRARHHAVDDAVEEALRSGRAGQVLEIAAGWSGRGLRLRGRHPGLRYVEVDLPDVAAGKARRLEDGGHLGPDHAVLPADALRDEGPLALASVAARALTPGVGVVVVTEGLVNYLPLAEVRGLWRRVAALLGAQGGGVYVSDLHVADEVRTSLAARAFEVALSAFAGGVHVPLATADDGRAELLAAGFTEVSLAHPPPRDATEAEAALVRIVRASVTGRSARG